MDNSNKISLVLLGAAVGVALIRFFNMTEKEREEFFKDLKQRVTELLSDTEGTIEHVKHHFALIDAKGKDEWVDKIMIFKRLLNTLFGQQVQLLSSNTRA
jgi:hypothetical protein